MESRWRCVVSVSCCWWTDPLQLLFRKALLFELHVLVVKDVPRNQYGCVNNELQRRGPHGGICQYPFQS